MSEPLISAAGNMSAFADGDGHGFVWGQYEYPIIWPGASEHSQVYTGSEVLIEPGEVIACRVTLANGGELDEARWYGGALAGTCKEWLLLVLEDTAGEPGAVLAEAKGKTASAEAWNNSLKAKTKGRVPLAAKHVWIGITPADEGNLRVRCQYTTGGQKLWTGALLTTTLATESIKHAPAIGVHPVTSGWPVPGALNLAGEYVTYTTIAEGFIIISGIPTEGEGSMAKNHPSGTRLFLWDLPEGVTWGETSKAFGNLNVELLCTVNEAGENPTLLPIANVVQVSAGGQYEPTVGAGYVGVLTGEHDAYLFGMAEEAHGQGRLGNAHRSVSVDMAHAEGNRVAQHVSRVDLGEGHGFMVLRAEATPPEPLIEVIPKSKSLKVVWRVTDEAPEWRIRYREIIRVEANGTITEGSDLITGLSTTVGVKVGQEIHAPHGGPVTVDAKGNTHDKLEAEVASVVNPTTVKMQDPVTHLSYKASRTKAELFKFESFGAFKLFTTVKAAVKETTITGLTSGQLYEVKVFMFPLKDPKTGLVWPEEVAPNLTIEGTPL